MYRTCTSLGIQISGLKPSTARRTGEHIRHLTHSQFKDSRCIRSFEYTSSLFQTFANIQNISMEPQLILVEINFYRSCHLSKSWKSEFTREFPPCLNLNMNYIQTLSNWWKITFEFKESQGWFFQSKSYFVFEKSKLICEFIIWVNIIFQFDLEFFSVPIIVDTMKELITIASYTSRSIGLWSQNASSPQMEVNRNRVLGSLPMWLRSWNDISPTFKSCLAPFRL